MSKPSTRSLDIIYVGTLPPHPGGSAISCGQLLVAIAALGNTVRAISPVTAESIRGGDAFASAHPEIRGSRILVPYFNTEPNVPALSEYCESEQLQVERRLLELIAERRPDLLFIGRESFATFVVPIATLHGLPCVLRIAGSQIQALASGDDSAGTYREFRKLLGAMDLVVTQAPHMDALLAASGCRRRKTIPNAIDPRQFSPQPRSTRLLREMELPENATIVMHASNMKRLKRPLDIVLSAAAVLRKVVGLFYVIAGDGPMLGEMKHLCNQMGLSASFRFTGWVDYDRCRIT